MKHRILSFLLAMVMLCSLLPVNVLAAEEKPTPTVAPTPTPTPITNPFEDVKDSDWFYEAVLWAVENGITAGTAKDKFSPDDICTRAQVVTFLYAAEGRPEIDGINVFQDVSDTDWFTVPVIWARENGITDGVSAGMFGPERTCTRGQIVLFLYKASQIK
ncbi:MAG: S-layer homology domain-containing protein [Oscillospiraceae bacterium]|nr:S-layer homology domain-containing protein [Oscillospiraceae bacterium]